MILGSKYDYTEIAGGCIAGIIALAKDVLQTDSTPGDGDNVG